jgi:hypothetical protein
VRMRTGKPSDCVKCRSLRSVPAEEELERWYAMRSARVGPRVDHIALQGTDCWE